MVSGCGDAVIATSRVSQCADTHSTARGRGCVSARRRHARRQGLSSIAFIGEPWPMNSTGIRAFISAGSMRGPRNSSSRAKIGPRSSWPGTAHEKRATELLARDGTQKNGPQGPFFVKLDCVRRSGAGRGPFFLCDRLHRQADAALLVHFQHLDLDDVAFLELVGNLLDAFVGDLR